MHRIKAQTLIEFTFLGLTALVMGLAATIYFGDALGEFFSENNTQKLYTNSSTNRTALPPDN